MFCSAINRAKSILNIQSKSNWHNFGQFNSIKINSVIFHSLHPKQFNILRIHRYIRWEQKLGLLVHIKIYIWFTYLIWGWIKHILYVQLHIIYVYIEFCNVTVDEFCDLISTPNSCVIDAPLVKNNWIKFVFLYFYFILFCILNLCWREIEIYIEFSYIQYCLVAFFNLIFFLIYIGVFKTFPWQIEFDKNHKFKITLIENENLYIMYERFGFFLLSLTKMNLE